MKSRMVMLVAVVMASLFFSACGSGSGSTKTSPASTYTVGGTVSGLPRLALGFRGLELQNNGGDSLAIDGNGSSPFPLPSPAAQLCRDNFFAAAQPGNANLHGDQWQRNSQRQCRPAFRCACTTNTYTIGGTVSGLSGSGLVLQDNDGDNLSVGANGSFAFRHAHRRRRRIYVTVLTQPTSPAQTCVVTSGSGTATNADVTSVQVACSSASTTYTIGGTVSGLLVRGLCCRTMAATTSRSAPTEVSCSPRPSPAAPTITLRFLRSPRPGADLRGDQWQRSGHRQCHNCSGRLQQQHHHLHHRRHGFGSQRRESRVAEQWRQQPDRHHQRKLHVHHPHRQRQHL